MKGPVLQAELQSVLCAAIDQLPADHRAIFLQHEVEGLFDREIAAALRVKVATIKSRMHRARLASNEVAVTRLTNLLKL